MSNQIKEVISILESAFTNKQPTYEVTVIGAEGARQETESHEEHLEALIEIAAEKLYDCVDSLENKYLDDSFTFSIVKFIDKQNEVTYRLYGYPETGDEVEFGMRPLLVEIVSLLERYSQLEPDFQIVHEGESKND